MGQNLQKIILKNGRIVLPDTIVKGDLLVEGEKISDFGGTITDAKAMVVDAKGGYILAGGIDVHTHFNLDIGIARAQDDFFTGTRAAALGGTTMIIDHPGFGPAGCSLFHQIEKYHGYARGRAVIDYAFHGVLQHVNDRILEEFSALADQGITSLKTYTTYDYRLCDSRLLQVFKAARKNGLVVAVHAEDHELIQTLVKKYTAQGRKGAVFHGKSRPPRAEALAVKRMIRLAGEAGNAALYIVHLSTRDGLCHVADAREKGQNVFAETCPQYLVLDESLYPGPDHQGLKYVMSPPLRGKEHQKALWQGLLDNTISVVATDHCPFDFELKKKLAAHDFSKCPGGCPGVETRVGLMFTKGVLEKKMSVNAFSRMISGNPARLMGLYPQKGVIAKGSDADLIILNPGKEQTVSKAMLHENVDYCAFEGIKVKAWPSLTMVRGSIIVRDGKFTGTPGFGKFIKRKRYPV